MGEAGLILVASGTWKNGYRPTTISIQHDAEDIGFDIGDTDDNVIVEARHYISNSEVVINWLGLDIHTIGLLTRHYESGIPFKVSKIVFI